MYKSLQDLLLDALHRDDFESFTSTLENNGGWPTDTEWSDYDLLMNAVKLKNRRIVTYLLDKGCRVYAKPGILTPLHFAVTNEGWCDIVVRLILMKCPVDEKYRDGKDDTAIHYAYASAYENDVSGEVVDVLLRTYLRSHACENVVNDENLSFLHIACSRPSVEVVKCLVEADPRAIDLSEEGSFFTPLHVAVQYQRYAVAEYLLQSKAKIYKQNCNKSTPLHLALKLHDFKMINLILDHDEWKENVVDEFGLSHFMAACAGNNETIVKEYLRLAEKRFRIAPSEFINAKVRNLEGYEGYTPLHYAVDFGLQTRTVKLLLEHGADCCAAAGNGKTPHMLAREKGHDLMCSLLNEHCSIFKECRDTVATFLNFENVSPVNEMPVDQPPKVSVAQEPKKILSASLNKQHANASAKVPIPRDHTRTLSVLPPPPKKRQAVPIPVAILSNSYLPFVVCNTRPETNEIAVVPPTPVPSPPPPPPAVVMPPPPSRVLPVRERLKKAMEDNDFDEFVTILQQHGCPARSQFQLLMTAIRLERKRMVLALLDVNCQATKYDVAAKSSATTALHLVAPKVGWSDVVERLLAKGCRADAKNCKGETPLHLAFLAGNVDATVDILLKDYSDGTVLVGRHRNCKGRDGFLHIACTRTSLDVVRKFVKSGLQNYRLDSRYSASSATPLHFAVTHKRHEIAQYLIRLGADIYLRNTNGLTPLHLSLEMRDAQMIDLILANDKDRKDAVDRFGASHFMAACAGSDLRIVQEYLWNAERQTKSSPYALIFAQVKNHECFAISGYTPLHFAAHFNRVDTLELLLGYGADCCLVTASGSSCHDLARTQGHKQVYRILKEHCEVFKRCRETRAQSPDFGRWGEKYEWDVLLERTKTIKSLRGSLRDFRSMSLFGEVIDVDD